MAASLGSEAVGQIGEGGFVDGLQQHPNDFLHQLIAGYMEQWEYHKTYSGTPQGSGMSPILANIYLSELDTFMEEYKARFDTEPFKRNASKEYEKIARRYRKAKKKLDAGDHSKEAVQEFKTAQKLKLSTPYADVLDADFKRILNAPP